VTKNKRRLFCSVCGWRRSLRHYLKRFPDADVEVCWRCKRRGTVAVITDKPPLPPPAPSRRKHRRESGFARRERMYEREDVAPPSRGRPEVSGGLPTLGKGHR
jgi:hypothetical protein